MRSPHRLWTVLVAVIAGCITCGDLGLNAQARSEEIARDKWQRVDDIVAALKVAEGSRVADVGAGPGYFTVRLARKVGPTGRVLAVDINQKRVDELRERAKQEGLSNVEPIHSEPADPKLPPDSLDAVLIVNAYHEMREYQSILEHIRNALRPGGRLVLVEPMKPTCDKTPRSKQQDAHVLDPALGEADLRQAGFQIVDRQDTFVRRPDEAAGPEWLLVAER